MPGTPTHGAPTARHHRQSRRLVIFERVFSPRCPADLPTVATMTSRRRAYRDSSRGSGTRSARRTSIRRSASTSASAQSRSISPLDRTVAASGATTVSPCRGSAERPNRNTPRRRRHSATCIPPVAAWARTTRSPCRGPAEPLRRETSVRSYNGLGVGRDYEAAVAWYRRAAEQGDADAQLALGNMYRDGQGAPAAAVPVLSIHGFPSAGT